MPPGLDVLGSRNLGKRRATAASWVRIARESGSVSISIFLEEVISSWVGACISEMW